MGPGDKGHHSSSLLPVPSGGLDVYGKAANQPLIGLTMTKGIRAKLGPWGPFASRQIPKS